MVSFANGGTSQLIVDVDTNDLSGEWEITIIVSGTKSETLYYEITFDLFIAECTEVMFVAYLGDGDLLPQYVINAKG